MRRANNAHGLFFMKTFIEIINKVKKKGYIFIKVLVNERIDGNILIYRSIDTLKHKESKQISEWIKKNIGNHKFLLNKS